MRSRFNKLFEAVTKTLINEEYHNDALMVKGGEYIVQAEVSGDDVEITTLFKYDKKLDDHREINLHSISPQLRQDIEDAVLNDVGGKNYEDNEDFGNTDYDIEEGNIFERLEELMRSKPELENDLKPILDDFQDIIEDINSLDVDDDKIDVTDLGIHLNRLFPDV